MARKKRVERGGGWKKYVFWAVVVVILLVVIYSGGIILGMVACPPIMSPAACAAMQGSPPPIVTVCTAGAERENVNKNCGGGGLYGQYCEGHMIEKCSGDGSGWVDYKCSTSGERKVDYWGCWDCSDDVLNPEPLANPNGHEPMIGDWTTSCSNGCIWDVPVDDPYYGTPKWKGDDELGQCPTAEEGEGYCKITIGTKKFPSCICKDENDVGAEICINDNPFTHKNTLLICRYSDDVYWETKEICDAEDGVHVAKSYLGEIFGLCKTKGDATDPGTYYTGSCQGDWPDNWPDSYCKVEECEKGVGSRYECKNMDEYPYGTPENPSYDSTKCVNPFGLNPIDELNPGDPGFPYTFPSLLP